jgi:hypothetical protein
MIELQNPNIRPWASTVARWKISAAQPRADKEAASRRCLPEWSVWSGAELHRTTPWPSLRQARHPLKLKGQPQDDHPY